jgi:hypothetical protein
MDLKGMTVGDIKTWATGVLHKELESVINAKAGMREPYYIFAVIKEGYDGPAAFGNNNELLHGEDTRRAKHYNDTRTVDLSKKRVVTHRFILMRQPPPIPLLNSSLWRVNNKTGEVKCCWILPPDKPMIAGFDVELESQLVTQCGSNMPYVYGKEN